MIYPTFQAAIADTRIKLQRKGSWVHTENWQGVNISKKPEMETWELLHHSFSVDIAGWSLDMLADDIKPNLPWADDHFDERVCGAPINPGIQWEKWPYNKSAATFLDRNGQFNHNYMERYWPKLAGQLSVSTKDYKEWAFHLADSGLSSKDYLSGVRYDYGDLNDVVDLLAGDPTTRQAFLPVWFPEDTGGGNKRAPCTLGYHFIMRNGLLDVTYYIRSCDYVRHFRDDIYLTVRLALWVIERCREKSELWENVAPGTFNMHITSLHLFKNDYQAVFG